MTWRYEKYKILLDEFSCIEVKGDDAFSFLQGQITTNLELRNIDFSLSSRLNRQGQVLAFFYILKIENNFHLLCLKELTDLLVDDLSKFIIMEDVALEVIDHKYLFYTGPGAKGTHRGFFLGEEGFITQEDQPEYNVLDDHHVQDLKFFSGFDEFTNSISIKSLFTDSLLSEFAYSNDKGCFLGNEVVGKVLNGKGSNRYPVLIEKMDCSEKEIKIKLIKENNNFFIARLGRENRVESSLVSGQSDGRLIKGKVVSFPYFKDRSFKDKSSEYYILGVNAFNKGRLGKAKLFFSTSLLFFEKNTDVFEMMGVLLGREKKYEEAISWMDRLSVAVPDSIMAHTNKSLFLMNLGKIEEAEEEKSKATLKSFEKFGREAELKKNKIKENDDLKSKISMFEKILEIDPVDEFALFSLGEIQFKLKDYESSKAFFEKLISLSKKMPKAYLYLGKIFQIKKDKEQALLNLEKGIDLSAKLGDLNLANQIKKELTALF